MSPRGSFVARRLLFAVPVLAVMSVFVFLMIRLVPGDPVQTMLGFRATPENAAQVRSDLGLDRSLVSQYVDYVGGVVHGDLGRDYVSRAPVSTLLAQRLPVTVELTVLAMALAVLVGVPLGVSSAARAGPLRTASEGFVVAGISIADFWLGIMLVLVFAGTWHLLPPSGFVRLTEDPLGNLRYLALPVITLAFGEAAYILRTTRGAMDEVLGTQYVLFLRAKGVSERRIVYRHALRNASPTIATVVGIQFGVLLGGAIVIETLFALPGVGRLIVTSIQQRNYTVVQGGVMVVAGLFILVTLLTDIAVGWLDPRIGEGQGS
ncbi:MAG: ABC transporter permease [Actinomycetota bacterium]